MTNISKANGNSEKEINAAFRLAIREAIAKGDAEVKRTGKAATIETGITFNFGGRA